VAPACGQHAPEQGFFASRSVLGRGQTQGVSDPLRDELLRPPAEAWRPDPGDVLVGEVVELDEREGFAGVRYPVVTVRTDVGEYVAFHAFHTVARDELARWEPKIGERLGVAYHGLVEKGESSYELYRMKVVREHDVAVAGAEPDWAAIGGQAEELGRPEDEDGQIPF
jgi:hypothetical protein